MTPHDSSKFAPHSTSSVDDDQSIKSDSDQDRESMNDSSRGNSGDEDTSQSSKEQYVREETKRVQASKMLVYVVLAACAAGSAVATWFFVRGEEKNEFEDEVGR